METSNKIKTTIIWNGQGGQLDSVTVTHALEDDDAVARALIKMVRNNTVAVGDSFIIKES